MGLQIRSPAAQIKTTQFLHTAATTPHAPIVDGGHVFIPTDTADANALNGFVYEAEISGGAKAVGAIAVGDKIYWDDTAKAFTTTTVNNTLVGYALEAALSADTVTGLIAFSAFAV